MDFTSRAGASKFSSFDYTNYSNTLTLYISFYTTHARQVIKSREIKTIKYTTRLKCGVLSQAWVLWVWVYGFISSQEPHEEPPLLHLSHLEIREKFLDRLIYRPIDRNGFHRCLCARLLDRPAGFHLEHCVLEHHLLSEQGVNVSKLVR